MIVEHTATITTGTGAAEGDATVYVGAVIRGRIIAIKYLFGDLANTLDLTITGNTTGVPILTYANVPAADAWWYPRAVATKVADGANSTISEAEVWLYNESAKIVVAQGGDTKAGTIILYVDE